MSPALLPTLPPCSTEAIRHLSGDILDELLNTLGLPSSSIFHQSIRPILGKATNNFARIALKFDQLIAEQGLPIAAEWTLSNWCRTILAHGREHIPPQGPLLVISNHPGAYDALVIASQVARPDLRILVSDFPFLRSLQNFSQRLFFIPINKSDTFHRMSGLLSAVRYLKQGGAVLLMGSGTLDPDPAVSPGALAHLQRWTEAVDVFLHAVPQTQLILSAVSHVLSPRWARHPLTWLQQGGLQKRRLAEIGQICQQLFFPGSLFVSPCLSFSPLLTPSDLTPSPRADLIRRETSLLHEHCRSFGGFLP